MAKVSLVTGTTSYIFQVFIQDSSSTTGAGLTGLVFNSGSLVAYYHRDTDTTATAITLVTMTVGTFTSSGFKEIDATNMPGWYQVCAPNAALASGAKNCAIHLKGAANMAPLAIEIELTAVNNQDAVRGGMTAMPNVASGSAGAIITSGTGTAQLSVASGLASANATQLAGQTITAAAGVTFPTSIASPTNITAGVITTVTTLTNAPSDSSGTTTLLSRLTSTRAGYLDNLSAGAVALASSLATLAGKFTGITLLAQWLGAAFGKQTADATALTEINATGAGSGTFVGGASESLESLKDDQMTAGDLQDAVWDVAIAGHVDAGSTGEALNDASTGSSLTVQAIVDGVWDEPIADHLDSGSTGASLNGAGSAGDPWGTTLPGAYGAGTAGKIVGDNLNATVSSRATPAQVATELGTYDGPTNAEMVARTLAAASYADATNQAAIKAKTDNLPAAPASTTNITAGTITTVTNLTNAPTAGDLTTTMKASVTTAATAATPTAAAVTGSVGSLGTTAKSDVRTQAGNALADYGAIP